MTCDILVANERCINISCENSYEVLSDLHCRHFVETETIWLNVKLTEKFLLALSARKYKMQPRTAKITDETRDWPLFSKCALYTAWHPYRENILIIDMRG